MPLSSAIAVPKKCAPTPENHGCSFETSVNSNPVTQRHISEDLNPKNSTCGESQKALVRWGWNSVT